MHLKAIRGLHVCSQRKIAWVYWIQKTSSGFPKLIGFPNVKVFSWPGFHFGCIVLDWMHMVDLGCAQVCLGNVLFELFKEMGGIMERPTPTMAQLQQCLQDVAAAQGVEVPTNRLQFKMIRGSDRKPRLRMKAARVRAMAPLVLEILRTHFPAGNDRDLRREKCVAYLCAAYKELDNWSDQSAARLQDFCRRHLLLFMSLAREVVQTDGEWVRWRFFPKAHMLQHLAGAQARRWGNPKEWWCYTDESVIGMVVRLAETCHPSTLATACCSKYLVLALLEP